MIWFVVPQSDWNRETNPTGLRGLNRKPLSCLVYIQPQQEEPSLEEREVSSDHGHAIARQTCVHRQPWKHGEQHAWTSMET